MNKQEAIDALECFRRNAAHILGDNAEKVKTIETCIMLVEEIEDEDLNAPNVLNALDCISRQAALDAPEKLTKDCNPEHFVGHQKFIEFMDDAEVGSFGNWQFANGFNLGLTAAEVEIEKLPSAQPVIRCKDCKNFGGGTYCYERDGMWDENDFCSYAERRGEEDEDE